VNRTDVTIEIYNQCAGSCTGCLLSTLERRDERPVMAPSELRDVAARIASYGKTKGLEYRAVLVFGDVPAMPLALQEKYYDACREAGLALGVTMALVSNERDAHYDEALPLITQHDPDAVFDITLDPVRLARDDVYAARIKRACDRAPVLHLQVLLSEAVMSAWSPEALCDLLDEKIGSRSVSLGFTPSLINLERKNYLYDVSSAADFAARFHARSDNGRDHLAREMARFASAGSFSDFLGQAFHVAPGKSVHAVAYTIFGDMIFDTRNKSKALGRMGDESLGDILSGRVARRLSAMNEAWLDMGDFGCGTCTFRESCKFAGVGLARMAYKGHEARIGSCYGPAAMGAAA
jgi:hypothetical protein